MVCIPQNFEGQPAECRLRAEQPAMAQIMTSSASARIAAGQRTSAHRREPTQV